MAAKKITLMDTVVGLLLGSCMMISLFSCASGDSPVWPGHPAYPAGQGSDPRDFQRFFINDQYSIVLGNNPKYSLAMVGKDNTSLILQTDLGISGAVKSVPGVVINDTDGGSLIVRFDERGWPKHAVYQNPVLGNKYFYFVDWTDNSVEVLVILSTSDSFRIRVQLDDTLRLAQGVMARGFPRYSGFIDMDEAYPYQDRRINEQKINSGDNSEFPGMSGSRNVNFYSGAYSVAPRVMPKTSAPSWQSQDAFRISTEQLIWASAATVVTAAASGAALQEYYYYYNNSSYVQLYGCASDYFRAITYANEQIGSGAHGEISPVTNPDDCIYAPVNPWTLATKATGSTDSVILPAGESAYEKINIRLPGNVEYFYMNYLPGGWPEIGNW
jgi:hypothetical protein